MKTEANKIPPKRRWYDDFRRSIYLLVILAISFGFAPFSRAAVKVKRGLKAKKQNLKASYEALLSARAWTFFRPAWSGTTAADLPAEVTDLKGLMEDPEGRIERPFKPSSALRGRVAFWVDVYARFSSRFRIVHDKDNPELIYGYIDFRSIYRSMPAPMARARAHQIEQRILQELKNRISEATHASKSKESNLSDTEKQEIVQLLARHDVREVVQVQKRMRRLRAQSGQKEHFLQALHRSEKLIPQIEAILKARGLPLALARLPFVESSFNPRALSKVGAMGIWQFMPETLARFNPRSTRAELASPLLQSHSAAHMFEILHSKFDDWGLAITAYNSGAARVKRISEKHSADNVEEMIRVPLAKGNLGFAGNNFFCEFLAAGLVEAYKDKIFTSAEVQLAKVSVPKAPVGRRKLQSIEDAGASVVIEPMSVLAVHPATSLRKVVASAKGRRTKAKMRAVKTVTKKAKRVQLARKDASRTPRKLSTRSRTRLAHVTNPRQGASRRSS